MSVLLLRIFTLTLIIPFIAFGHCGDITAAVEIMDEMTYDRLPITTESFNFLLQACISLPKDGFTHAVQVRITFGIFKSNLYYCETN